MLGKEFFISSMRFLMLTMLVGCIFCSTQVLGQTDSETGYVTSGNIPDLERELLPLDEIMNVGIKNSPYLKQGDAIIKGREEEITLARRDFHKNLSAVANYSTGNQRFMMGVGTDNAIQNNFLDGYRVGINLNIPLSDFTTRKQRINVAQAELEATRFQRDQTEMELKRQIAMEYNSLLSAQRILRINSSNLETARLTAEMADRQFKEGGINVQEYARVSEILNRAEISYEASKREFLTQYMQFESLLGVPLTRLMKKQ